MHRSTLALVLALAGCGADADEAYERDAAEASPACVVALSAGGIDPGLPRQHYGERGELRYHGDGEDEYTTFHYTWRAGAVATQAAHIHRAGELDAIRTTHFDEEGRLLRITTASGPDADAEELEARDYTTDAQGRVTEAVSIRLERDAEVEELWRFSHSDAGWTWARQQAGGEAIDHTSFTTQNGRVQEVEIRAGGENGEVFWTQSWTWEGSDLTNLTSTITDTARDRTTVASQRWSYLPDDALPWVIVRELDTNGDGSPNRIERQDFSYEGDCAALDAAALRFEYRTPGLRLELDWADPLHTPYPAPQR